MHLSLSLYLIMVATLPLGPQITLHNSGAQKVLPVKPIWLAVLGMSISWPDVA